MRIGAVPLPLNPLLPASDLGLSIAEARARACRLGGARARRPRAGRARSRFLAHVLVAEGSPPPVVAQVTTASFDDVLAQTSFAGEPYDTREDSPGFWPAPRARRAGRSSPCTARPTCGSRRGLRARGARDRARGSLLLGRPALPRLRPRQRARLSVGGGVCDPGTRPAAKGGPRRRGGAGAPTDALLLRAHVLRRAAGRRSPRGHLCVGTAGCLRRGALRGTVHASASDSASRSSTGSARRR